MNNIITGKFDNTDIINEAIKAVKMNNENTSNGNLINDKIKDSYLNNIMKKKINVVNFAKGAEKLLKTELKTEQLKNDFANYITGHIVVDYIPFAKKADLCKRIVDVCNYISIGNGEKMIRVYKQDSVAMHILFTLTLIDQYTDIEINYENIIEDYDALEKYGLINLLISAIPENECNAFDDIMEMIIEDIHENERSIAGMTQGIKDGIGKVFGAFFDGIIEQMAKEGISMNDIISGLNRLLE